MANFLGLLVATLVIFIIARLMKDAKAFAKLMAMLAFGLIVGYSAKSAATTANDDAEKTVVVSTDSTSTHSASPLVLEKVDARLDYASKNKVDRDSVETETEGLLTSLNESEFIDDS